MAKTTTKPVQAASGFLADRVRGLGQEMNLVPVGDYQIQPVLMIEQFRRYLAIRPEAKGDLVCLYGQVSKDLSLEGEFNLLTLSGFTLPFLKLALIIKGSLERGDIVYLITSRMAPATSQKIKRIPLLHRIEKSRKWTTKQPMSLHFLTGKMTVGSISPSVEAGFSTGDQVPVLGIDFVASITYTFKLSTYTLKKSDISWFDLIDKKLENRFNKLLGLNKIPELILKKLLKTLLNKLNDVKIAINKRSILNDSGTKKIEDILTELQKAQRGNFNSNGILLTETEKNDPVVVLKWIDNKKGEIQEAFQTFTQKFDPPPSVINTTQQVNGDVATEPEDDLLFLKGNQSGIILMVDGYYHQLQEAVKADTEPLQNGEPDICYLEIKRYDHELKPGIVYSLTLADPSGSGVTGEGTHAIAMTGSITKSVYQTYVKQTHASTERKLILTQSNRVVYKKIEIPSTVEGVVKIENVEAGLIGSHVKPILNIMDYRSVSVYWNPDLSKEERYTVSPLPGSGISFGSSVMLVDLENAAKELEVGSSSPYYEKKIKGYAKSLHVEIEVIQEFLKQFGKEMTAEVKKRMKGYQMVLLESAYRYVGENLNINVIDYKNNRLEELRDVQALKNASALSANYGPNMEDLAGMQLESIMVRFRIADSSSSEKPIFRLGYYDNGTGGSVMFTGKEETGNQGIINFSPYFLKDMPDKALTDADKIDQAVPPVFLVPHSL